MEDQQIIALYWERSEAAIAQTARKFGNYCYQISWNILNNREDCQECVNDTYLAAWNTIPPRRPSVLATFLGKLTRNISLDRWKSRMAYKRGGGEVPLALEELEECVSGGETPEEILVGKELGRHLSKFLETLPQTERRVFVCRYWYLDPIESIAQRFGFSKTKVTSMLHRTRGKLHRYLEKEGLL